MIATSVTEPIISPWLIYAIDILNSISGAATFVCAVSVVVLFFLLLTRRDRRFDSCDEFIHAINRLCKRAIIVFLSAFLVAMIVLNKRTSYEMLAAAYVTPANVEQAADILSRFADRILKDK